MIGLLLVVIAAVLAVEMKSLLLGESASREHQTAIRNALPGDGVDSIIHMRTMHPPAADPATASGEPPLDHG
jgi:hypothetical protein